MTSRRYRYLLLASVTMQSTASLMVAQDVAAQTIALDEIVVTARKREESLLEIPVSVSAFSQDQLDAMGASSLEALSKVTPGFVLENVGPGGSGGRQNPAIRFRGLAVQQPSPASRAGAVFWDGGYISDGAGILPLFDLERVEVIKGPQNAFFGRNTFAGAVNYIPAEPGDELSGKGSVSISPSRQTSYNASAAVGGPITDNVGLRVAATHSRVGADFEYLNGDPAGEENTTAVSLVSTFQANEDFSLKASGFFVRSDDTRAQQSQHAPVLAGTCNLTYSGEIRNVADGTSGGTFTTDLSQSLRNTFCGSIPDWDDVPPNTCLTSVKLRPARLCSYFQTRFPSSRLCLRSWKARVFPKHPTVWVRNTNYGGLTCRQITISTTAQQSAPSSPSVSQPTMLFSTITSAPRHLSLAAVHGSLVWRLPYAIPTRKRAMYPAVKNVCVI